VVAELVDALGPYWRVRQRHEEERAAHEIGLVAARSVGDLPPRDARSAREQRAGLPEPPSTTRSSDRA
jgi:hypothetical protein